MKQIIFLFIYFFISDKCFCQWLPAEGIYGGQVNSLIQTQGKLVASMMQGGVYVSSDTGKTWIKTQVDIKNLLLAGKYIYGDGNISADGGQTWTGSNVLFYDAFSVGDSLLSFGMGGPICSVDSGFSWQPCNINLNFWNVLREANNKVYAATNAGIYVTADNYNSWTRIDSGFTTPVISKMIVCDTVIHAVNSTGLYTSVNSGQSWSLSFQGAITHLISIDGRLFVNDQLGYLHYSDDHAQTWDTCFYSIAFTSLVKCANTLFNSNEAGIFKSENGGLDWVKSDSLMYERPIINIEKCGPYVFASGFREGLYRSGDGGVKWQKIKLPEDDIWGHVNKMFVEGNTLSLSWWGHGMLTTTDFGATWTQFLPTKALTSVAKKGSVICCSDIWGYTYSSVNGGMTWSSTNLNVPAFGFNNIAITDSSIIGTCYNDGIYRSDDNGASWNLINPNQAGVSLKWTNNKLYATNYLGNLSVSSDYGITWTTLFTGNNSPAHDVKIDNNRIWLVTEKKGPYFSDDDGLSFDSTAINLQHNLYSVCATNSLVLVGTDRGLWRSQEFINLVSDLKLKEPLTIYPNPTNGLFNIRFQNKFTGKISVFDITGRTVSCTICADASSQEINLVEKPAGIYLITIEGDKVSDNRKIIVSR